MPESNGESKNGGIERTRNEGRRRIKSRKAAKFPRIGRGEGRSMEVMSAAPSQGGEVAV